MNRSSKPSFNNGFSTAQVIILDLSWPAGHTEIKSDPFPIWKGIGFLHA